LGLAVFLEYLICTATFDTVFGGVGDYGSVALDDFDLGESSRLEFAVHAADAAGLAALCFDAIEVAAFVLERGTFSFGQCCLECLIVMA
jgi:hypothetical protein